VKQILIIIFLSYSVNWSQVYMNIKNKDGTTQSFNIEDVRKLTFSGNVVGIKEGEIIGNAIKSFTLLQNYPNPFNPSTTIEYQIPKAGNVEINIYNITGQLIRTIESGFKNAGNYKVTWNSRNDFNQIVASGIYISNVKYNNSFLTKKIILLK
jgi:flagellar hook assembly protein FlgD